MRKRVTFAEAVRHVRTRRKLTQAALAEKARLSRTQLVRIEGGLKPGSLASRNLIGALGFASATELFAGAGDTDAAQRLKWFAQGQTGPRAKALVQTSPRNESTRWKVI